jgi:YbbR domain-containing protein
LLAIAFAVALWSVVAYAQNPTQSKGYALPIDHPAVPSGLVIVGAVPQVNVTAIGTADNLHSFDLQLRANPGMVHATANFGGTRVGRNDVPIHVSNADPNITMVAPNSISVALDELGSTTQPVAIERVHALPPGYHEQVSATTVTPATVKVDGPKSQFAGIEAVVQVDLDGLQAPTTVTSTVVIRDAKTKKPVPQMTVTPAQVSVKLVIQADAVTVSKPVGWTLTGQPAAGYRVSNVQIAPLEVQATGLQNTLAGLLLLATDPVDVTGAKADVIKTVTIRPPAGVDVNQKTAQVHVFISPAPGVSPSPGP